MSSSVLLPEYLVQQENMYAAFVHKVNYTNSSPRASPQISRRCGSSHSPSPSRERGRDKSPRIVSPKLNTARVNSSQTRCQKCHENQSSLINSVANLSICDKKKSDTSNRKTVVSPTLTGAITAPQVADLMQGHTPFLILDCRSFIAFNLCHLRGAINVGCADRITKKRLQSGKICVADLIKCMKTREQFVGRVDSEIVIYDDDSTEITEGSCASNSSLQLILKSLLSNDRKVHYLKGGLVEFHARYESLCNQAKAPPSTPLYSPTTPIISNEIDTATASKVLPFVYIGNERDASNRERLQDLGITHILNVTSHIPCYFEGENFVSYKRLQASDSGSQNLKQYFQEASQFIDDVRKSGGKVLVHCQAGVSRSATITVAFIMQHSKMSMMDAFKYVKSRRCIVAPNFNFMGQLMELEKCLNDGRIVRDLSVDLGINSLVK